MKNFFYCFALWLLVMGAALTPARAADNNSTNDPVVLKINEQEIKQSTVLQAMRIIAATRGEKNKEKLYDLAINDIIAQALSYELAVDKKFDRDSDINQYISNMARQSAEDLAQYKKQMMIAAWRDQLPVPDKTTAEWKKNYKDFVKKNPNVMLYRTANIVVATDAEAINVINQLKNGTSFAALAKQYSLNRTTAAKGGDVGFVSAAQLPPNIALVVASLKKNEFTNVPIRAAGGAHVIKLLDKKIGAPPDFNNSQDGLMMLEKEKIAMQKILERAKESTIVIIDKNNNQTPVTFQSP